MRNVFFPSAIASKNPIQRLQAVNKASRRRFPIPRAQASLPANACEAVVSEWGNDRHAMPAGNDVCAPEKGTNYLLGKQVAAPRLRDACYFVSFEGHTARCCNF